MSPKLSPTEVRKPEVYVIKCSLDKNFVKRNHNKTQGRVIY